uniref:EGF-like domain-containing protein n=1 Tax=Heterorhabditis bacteriophora TaxID=37862 RepID=A0A1I7WLI7_HETBA
MGEIDMMPNLRLFRLGDNPWHCDCRLKWMKRTLTGQVPSHAKCMRPAMLHGKNIDSVDESVRIILTLFFFQILYLLGIDQQWVIVNEVLWNRKESSDWNKTKLHMCLLKHSKTFKTLKDWSEVYQTQRADECFIDFDCPTQCTCHGTVVDCSNRGMPVPPTELPLYTTELNLSRNQITIINQEYNLSRLQNLIKLDLSHNQLSMIEEGSLSNMRSLRDLNLSNNKLRHFSSSSLGIFNVIEVLSLLNNHLKCITPNTFEGLKHLRTLRTISYYLTKLYFLRQLAGNDLPCDCHILPLIEWMRANASRSADAGQCSQPTPLTVCVLTMVIIAQQDAHVKKPWCAVLIRDLSHNRIESIEDYTFANLTRLSTLILSYNKLRVKNSLLFLCHYAYLILAVDAVGSNSLYCDCRMTWFSRWIKAKFVEAGIARCEAPFTVSNQLLLTAHNHQFICDGAVPPSITAKCDLCAASPCKNNARCETIGGRDYKCHCPAGFHGKNCQSEIDACFGHPCMNNATCKVTHFTVIQEGRFTCVCPKGFKGDYCEKNIDDCERHKCQNGGKCIDLINSYQCICGALFTGKYCEDKLEYCSKKLNPCQNGASCAKEGNGYSCKCLPGFTGQNCSVNIDDCVDNHCRNGGICIPPMNNALYPNTANCHSNSCGHGSCYTNEDMNDYECRCHEGYAGTKCDQMTAIGLQNSGAYVALEPWSIDDGNLTLTLRTTNGSGLVAYFGDEHFLSAELYDGRVKIAFYIGNYPASHMYSYVIVDDGMPHRIEIIVQGKKCSLTIDNQTTQSVENDGKEEQFLLSSKQYLYLGGLPKDRAARVKTGFHVKEPHSLKGCISDVFVNDVPIDFESAIEKEQILQGCSNVIDLCNGVDCGKGRCEANYTDIRGYICRCDQGHTGNHCQQSEFF